MIDLRCGDCLIELEKILEPILMSTYLSGERHEKKHYPPIARSQCIGQAIDDYRKALLRKE